MAEVFTQIINYMKNTPIEFSFNGSSYSFTWWEMCVGIMVISVGILVVEKILGD